MPQGYTGKRSNGMKILSIDTTSRIINIALLNNGRVFSIEKDIQSIDYESVVSLIKAILGRAKLEIEEIDYFGACTGPGSFTGIRIGLSTIKALAYSINKPIIGFKSLDLLAWLVKDKFSGLLCIMQDAKRDNLYSAVFRSDTVLRRISPYLLAEIPQVLKEIKKLNKKNDDIYFYGDIVLDYKDDIEKAFSYSIMLSHQRDSFRGLAMISLIQDNLRQKCNSFELLPFYIYPNDCQVRKSAK
jgi:tRNA threonylcarbamoyladenosine biosynthesis protein TsaB